MDTLPLDFEEQPAAPSGRPKGRRPRNRKTVDLAFGTAVAPAPKAPPALLRDPQPRACGFCGRKETILGDAAVCPQCGAVMVREGR